jgi:hypothetical protein|tara:strand:+ start:5054 stop:5797 length:744 start_codon:yes stop_codon:yes gene_type:complete
MTFEIVTYANKSQGMFEDLVNNEFDIPVTVLGWGTKWNGFSDKYKGMSKHLETKSDDDIVIFLDGFDTKINKNPSDVVELFKKFDCKVLVSRDPDPFRAAPLVFGKCGGKYTANSGLYMGYAKEVKSIIDEALTQKCEDDQTNLNTICQTSDYVKVDEEEVIFKNFGPLGDQSDTNAIFVSYPGSPSVGRYSRAIVEYTQFLYLYILCLLILGLAFFPQRQKVLLPTLLIFTTFYAFVADKSCTLHS